MLVRGEAWRPRIWPSQNATVHRRHPSLGILDAFWYSRSFRCWMGYLLFSWLAESKMWRCRGVVGLGGVRASVLPGLKSSRIFAISMAFNV